MADDEGSQSLTECPNFRRRIEIRTGRLLSIRTRTPLAKLRVGINSQSKSPLFKLPGEVRTQIYILTFREYYCGKEYSNSSTYKRPNHTAPKKTSTELLSTCRRVWLEAYHYPISLAVPTFWFWNGPRDLERLRQASATLERKYLNTDATVDSTPESETEFFERFFRKLTPITRTNISHVQIFASEEWLKQLIDRSNLTTYFRKNWFAAKVLTITIREGKWSKTSGSVDPKWMEVILASSLLEEVRELRLELEMPVAEKEALNTIAAVFASVESPNFTCNTTPEEAGWGTCISATIIWTARKPIPAFRKHIKGYQIRHGEVEDFGGVALPARPGSRGGKRSRTKPSVRWAPRISKHTMREGAAAALMEEWEREGSLLRLV